MFHWDIFWGSHPGFKGIWTTPTAVIYILTHTHTYICIPFHIFFHYGLSQGIEYSFLYCVVRPCLSILCLQSVQFSSVQSLSCVWLFATPWITAHQASLSITNSRSLLKLIPEFTQTHVCQVSDAIQPSHPLSSPSPPAPNPSQHQGLFQWVSSSHELAKVLEFQLQHQSFQWTPRTDLL